jgi:hypothetical protein
MDTMNGDLSHFIRETSTSQPKRTILRTVKGIVSVEPLQYMALGNLGNNQRIGERHLLRQ